MFSRDLARTAIGITGNIISSILFLSPMPTFYRIWKKKSVEQYSPVPYLATFVNCGILVFYGLPVVTPHSILITTINGMGLMIETIYIALFFLFLTPKKRLRFTAIFVMECIFLVVLPIVVLTLVHTLKLRSNIVGGICMVGIVLMYASPLSVMKMVYKTKSVEYMPFFLSFFAFLNGICWASYGLINLDPFIIAPNALGALLGLAQLLLHAIFYKSTKKIIAQKKIDPESSLTTKIHSENKSPTII